MHFLRAVILTCLLLDSGSGDWTAAVAANTLTGVSDGLVAYAGADGHQTDLGKFPYVSLTDASGRHACAGTLVSPIFVLTTASCVDGAVTGFDRYLSVANIGVRGVPDGGVLESSIAIFDVVVHENYRGEGGYAPRFDVAFVELETPFTVQPAVLPLEGRYGCNGGHLAAVSTASETTDRSEMTSFSLKRLSAGSFADCTGQIARNDAGDADATSFCLTAAEEKISVDTGSGVFCMQGPEKRPVLMSLASKSVDAKAGNEASSFVDISSYVPWIMKNEHVMETMAGVMGVNKEEIERHVVKCSFGSPDAPAGRFPYAVSVWPRTFIHGCDGTLIAPRLVLTAAACLMDVITRPYRVVSLIGNIDISFSRPADAENIPAKKILLHPDVKKGTDLAIIVLRKPSKSNPINLPTEDDFGCCTEKQKMTLFGWGPLTPGKQFSDQLQMGNTLYYSHDKCVAKFPNERFAPAEICCINEKGGTSLCADDVGTGLVFDGGNEDPSDDFLIGIGGSKNKDADCIRVPSRFIDVKSSLGWIKEIVERFDDHEAQIT